MHDWNPQATFLLPKREKRMHVLYIKHMLKMDPPSARSLAGFWYPAPAPRYPVASRRSRGGPFSASSSDRRRKPRFLQLQNRTSPNTGLAWFESPDGTSRIGADGHYHWRDPGLLACSL